MLAKKCFLVGIVALLSLSLAISAQPVHPTTGEPLMIDCLRGTPDAIDGDLSDWNLEAMTPAVLDAVEQLSSGQDIWTGPEDCSAEFYMLWDDVNIYMAVVVKDEKLAMNKTDGSIWNSDCVEMFFATTDAEAVHSWTNPTIHYQYGFNANNQTWNWCNMDGPGQSVPDYLQVASSVTADGYICEASIEYAQMSALDFSVGNTIGIHPCIDDTDIDDGDTEYQMSWTGLAAHDQSMGYGHMLLSADSVPEPEPEPAGPKIIYVTSVKDMDQNGVQDDLSWIEWLEAEGYEVDARPGYWIDPLDANDITELEAADLIIASRGMATNEYDGDETAKWNAITTPIICTNAWMIRTSRWIWMNSNSANKDAGAPLMLVLDPEHPIFKGVPVDQDGLVEILDPNVASGHTSFLNDILDVGNGTLLAQSLGVYNTAWIVEWEAGVEYFEGAGQVAGGPRILFMAGTQDDPYTVPDGNTAPVGVLNLNEAGKKMFLNAVKYMIPVVPVDPGTDGLLACYSLAGDVNDSSGNGIHGTIYNAETGGLGDGGSVWVDDPERGTVISFNGTADGAYVRAGEIPQMTLTNDFTWAFWAKQKAENTLDNDIILGNRMDENALDFVPRQFIKFTPTKFEWHMNGNPDDNLEYDDIPADVWLHHAVVKTGDQLTYYRNGVEHNSRVFTQPLDFPQPLFFGGDNEGNELENWNGLMSDVCIYDRALSAGEVLYLAGFRAPVDPGTDSLVAHYEFENDLTDSSGNGLDGVAIGDPTFVEGVVGMALDFNGDDYVDCGGAAEFSFTDAMTVSTWVNIRSRPVAWMAMVAKGENAWRLGVNNETTGIHYAFSGSGRGWLAANTATELAFDEWYHVAATYDTNVGATVYIDGEPDASNPDLDGIDTNEFPLLLGDNPEETGRLLDGMLDEIMIYNRALSKEEVLFLAGQ